MYRLFDDETVSYSTSYDIQCRIRWNFVIKQPAQKISKLNESISKLSTLEFEIEWTKWLWMDPKILNLFCLLTCTQSKLVSINIWMGESIFFFLWVPGAILTRWQVWDKLEIKDDDLIVRLKLHFITQFGEKLPNFQCAHMWIANVIHGYTAH